MTSITRLGILDFGDRRNWRPAWTALDETVRATTLAESLGYHRYWLAEHQAPGDPWGAAAIMIGHLAARTRRIRVGSAGVLWALHDPFDVAAEYRLLSALHPDRIDLGIAGGGASVAALNDRHDDRHYPTAVAELVDFLRRDLDDVRAGRLVPCPADVTVAMPWLLGGGNRSKDTALTHRTAFCYSLFHAPRVDPAVMADYLDRFAGPRPQAAICAAVICAETEREAHELRERQREILVARGAQLNACGSPAQCAEQLDALARTYGVEEVVIHDVSRTVPERRRCYELLAAELLPQPSLERAG